MGEFRPEDVLFSSRASGKLDTEPERDVTLVYNRTENRTDCSRGAVAFAQGVVRCVSKQINRSIPIQSAFIVGEQV